MTVRVAGFLSRFFVLLFLLCASFISRSSSSSGNAEKEKTLAMVKPDGVLGNHTDSIKKVILESGFIILRETIVQLDEQRVATFYAEHSSRRFFPNLIKYMTSGPVLVMVLEKKNAVADWRALIGPTDACKAKNTHPHRSYMLPTRFIALITLYLTPCEYKARITRPFLSYVILHPASEQCVGWTQKRTVFTVRIPETRPNERSHFSLMRVFRTTQSRHMTNCNCKGEVLRGHMVSIKFSHNLTP